MPYNEQPEPEIENQQHEHFCRAFCATPSKQFSQYTQSGRYASTDGVRGP